MPDHDPASKDGDDVPERQGLDGTTVNAARPRTGDPEARVPGLTLLWHPSLERVGDRCPLPRLDATGIALSRLEPIFTSPDGARVAPLADKHLSRQPIVLRRRDGGYRLEPAPQRLTVGGRTVSGPLEIPEARVREGIVLVLADSIAILLHLMPAAPPQARHDLGLVGSSPAMLELQEEIGRVCDLDVPVLLRGETGTGKELVARAIHDSSRRAAGPFVAVNMAGLPPALAAVELFGATRGAFTGADRSRPGFIVESSGGTLFLDEIGEMPMEVQVQLLRVLEDREVRALGAKTSQRVDLRVVAATDSSLEEAIAEGGFSQPLLHRLDGYSLRLPPLRQRLDDLGLLFRYLLRREMQEIGREKLLSPHSEEARWLPAEVFAHLASHDWPGNVRELGNVARRLAIRYGDEDQVPLRAAVAAIGPSGATHPTASEPSREAAAGSPSRPFRNAAELSDEEILEVLERHRWELKTSAAALGVSRPSLYRRIDKMEGVRKVTEMTREEIESCFRECGRSLDETAARLRVSSAALTAHMRKLELL